MQVDGSTVAVTGATGFLGSHTVEALQARGAHVRGVVRNPDKGRWMRDVEFARADLGDRDALRAAFEGVDAVVANAALLTRAGAPYEEYREANVSGVENVLHAAADVGVRRVVMVSSIAVYRVCLNAENDVDTPLLADVRMKLSAAMAVTDWRYALSKSEGERRAWQLAAERHLQLTSLRPGPIYGPRDSGATALYARWMRRRTALAPTVRMPHVHGRDVADAIVGALANDDSIGRPYNVTGPLTSPHEVLDTWRRLSGRGPRLVPVPVPVWLDFSDRDAARDLGFAPRDLESGLADVLASGAGPAA